MVDFTLGNRCVLECGVDLCPRLYAEGGTERGGSGRGEAHSFFCDSFQRARGITPAS